MPSPLRTRQRVPEPVLRTSRRCHSAPGRLPQRPLAPAGAPLPSTTLSGTAKGPLRQHPVRPERPILSRGAYDRPQVQVMPGGRKGSLALHHRTCHRMTKTQSPRMQRDPAATRILGFRPEGCHRSVLLITRNRVESRGELQPDLVHPPRFQCDLDPRPAGGASQHPVAQPRQASVRMLLVDHLRLSSIGDLPHPVGPLSSILYDPAFDHGPVALAHRPPLELLCQPPSCPRMTGNHQGPRNRPIQPVGHAQIDPARFGVPNLEESLDPRFNASRSPREPGLRSHPVLRSRGRGRTRTGSRRRSSETLSVRSEMPRSNGFEVFPKKTVRTGSLAATIQE